MKRGQANLLRAFCVWTAFVWFTFIKNIIGVNDRSAGFKAVHITLAVISLVFAAAAWVVVSLVRRSRADQPVADAEPAVGAGSR